VFFAIEICLPTKAKRNQEETAQNPETELSSQTANNPSSE